MPALMIARWRADFEMPIFAMRGCDFLISTRLASAMTFITTFISPLWPRRPSHRPSARRASPTARTPTCRTPRVSDGLPDDARGAQASAVAGRREEAGYSISVPAVALSRRFEVDAYFIGTAMPTMHYV